MPVTLTTALPLYAFSRNQLPVQLLSDDVITTAGVAAVIHLSVTGAVANGDTIRLTWTAGDIIFTAAAVPDASGEQIPSGAGDATHVAAVGAKLAKNYYIKRDYLVTWAGTVITLTARLTGADYSMIPVGSANLALSLFTAGVTQVLKSNFKHIISVWLSGAKIWESPLSLDYPAAAGITNKDIAAVIAPSLGKDAPDLTATSWQACPNTFQEYFIEFAQYFGDTPKVAEVTTSPVAYINRGALDMETAPGQTLAGFLNSGLAGLCLRQGSKVIHIQPDQPEWLYWINLTGADQNVVMQCYLYFNDTTSINFRTPVSLASANQKYYMPVGFTSLGLQSRIPGALQLLYYTVQVQTSAGSSLTAPYTYVIDRYREFPRYFIYLNSLGGYQTLYIFGRNAESTDRAKQDVSLQVTDLQAATTGRNVESTIRLTKKWTVNTGYRTRREILLLNDFLASEDKYYLLNGKLVPIGISSTNVPTIKDGENLDAAAFECYPEFDEWVFTDDPNQSDDPINVGSGISGGINRIKDNGDNANNPIYQDV